MKQFDSTAIGRAAPVKEWISAMEDAFRDTASGLLDVPARSHLERSQGTFLIMPCFGSRYFATKLVSTFPGNIKKHEPVIYGTVVLNDGNTGRPLAVLDGSKLTAMRTAAVGSVGIKHLAPEHASTLGVIGLGVQGLHQALFACEIRKIKELRILDHSEALMKRFEERFKAIFPHIRVVRCLKAEELCTASEIIITATGSHQPVIPASEKCWKGKTLIGIGSFKPEMREFPDELLQDLDQVFVDTMEGLHESGDLVIPLDKGVIEREQCYSLESLITGKVLPEGETRFFKSVGMAAFDLYGARLVYEKDKG